MYECIERPLSSLDRASALIVWAMRRWTVDKAAGGCANLHLGRAFHSYGLVDALPHFQVMMLTLSSALFEPLELGGEEVTEHEAIVLGLLRHLPGLSPDKAALATERMVGPKDAKRLSRTVCALSAKLNRQGLPGRYAQWIPTHNRKTQ